jgi:hypothetical protein
MGRLAMLRAAPDASLAPALESALTSADPGLRAVAARIVNIGRIVLLAPQTIAALEREQDDRVAAELVRGLLVIATAESMAAAERHLDRAGPATLAAFATQLGRQSADKLRAALPRLAARAAQAPDANLAPAVVMTGAQFPDERSALLQALYDTGHAASWRGLLTILTTPPSEPADRRLVVRALGASSPEIRRDTFWRIVRWAGAGRYIPTDWIEQASAAMTDASASAWDHVGLELLARVRGARPSDRTDVLKTEAAQHVADALWLASSSHLSVNERRAVRAGVGLAGDQDPRLDLPESLRGPDLGALAEGLQPRMAIHRVLDPVWPGFLGSLLETVGCQADRTLAIGLVQIEYRPDGRPARALLDNGVLPVECQPALRALPGITLVEDQAPLPMGVSQWLLLPVQRDIVACLDTPRAPLDDGSYAPEVGRRKTRDVRPARPGGISARGTLVIDATIGPSGCIRSARLLSSVEPRVDLAALNAVLDWRYAPAERETGTVVGLRVLY